MMDIGTETLGYAHPRYADSLREFGEPRELPRSGGWILVRPIPGTPYKDAMGCYPLFACRDWKKLGEDLEHVGSDLISLSLVADPFAQVDLGHLEHYFDLVKPFKTHYLVDLSHPLESFVHRVHRHNSLQSLAIMDVEVCCQPAQYLDDWIRLFDNLICKHNLRGIHAFSPKCFEVQLDLPGMVMFLGRRDGEIVGAMLVLIHDKVAYTHLSCFTNEGYKIKASYGICWKAFDYLSVQGIRNVTLGGMAGTHEGPSDGLAQFKRGWSNDKRMVYLCGRVFDREKYEALCQREQAANEGYFPTYRAGDAFNLSGRKDMILIDRRTANETEG